jgi:hypothetical protein
MGVLMDLSELEKLVKLMLEPEEDLKSIKESMDKLDIPYNDDPIVRLNTVITLLNQPNLNAKPQITHAD